MKVMRIRELREAADMTQVQLATQMGQSQGTISAWEAEVYLPKARQLPALAQSLNCKINDLYVDDGAGLADAGCPSWDESMPEEE